MGADPSDDRLLTFVPLEAVWPRQIDFTRERPKSQTSTGYTRFMDGDVIVPKITPTFEADRSTWVNDSPTDVLTGTTELHVVRPGPRLEPRYLDYVFSSHPFLQDGASQMVGVAGQKRIPDEWLRNYRIPIVALETQRKTADYLDRETARIDTLISKKRHLIKLLEEQDRRIIDDLYGSVLSNKLTRLGYVADVRSGVTLGGTRPRAMSEVTVPYLRVANVQHDRLDLREVKTVTVDWATAQRTMLRSGDVLMTREVTLTSSVGEPYGEVNSIPVSIKIMSSPCVSANTRSPSGVSRTSDENFLRPPLFRDDRCPFY